MSHCYFNDEYISICLLTALTFTHPLKPNDKVAQQKLPAKTSSFCTLSTPATIVCRAYSRYLSGPGMLSLYRPCAYLYVYDE